MFALIDPRSNRVCQLADSEFPVADPLFWAPATGSEIPDATTYVNGGFVAPPPPVVINQPPDPVVALAQQVADLQAALLAANIITRQSLSAAASAQALPS